MEFWQVIGIFRYLRHFTADGRPWTAVLSWHSEQGQRVLVPDACWLLRLGPGAPLDLDVPTVERTVRFFPADLDRSAPTPAYLEGDAESMDVQHALRTAERYVETELGGCFARLQL